MKTILVLLDTTRKDMLSIYNKDTDVHTPNLENLAEDSFVFDNHCTGSLPCMPARRDLFTGRLDFFERPWGALEPFDKVLQKELSVNGIPSHLITDHAHYWRHGGENYMQYFDTFIMNRGQESDPYQSYIDAAQVPKEVHGRFNLQFYKNETTFVTDDDFPVAKTFNGACEFLEKNKNQDSFFLQIEGFDPHEPFVSPQKYYDMYDVEPIGELYNSPLYGKCNDSSEQLEHLRKRYKANLTFADECLGRVIGKLKDLNIYDECNIIFTTDHGFHLGEHGSLGKGITHVYNEISEIPYLHKLPNQHSSQRISCLTQNIDVMPTLIEQYKISNVDFNFHGISYLPLMENREYKEREAVVSAYFGFSVMYKDKENTFFKAKKSGATESVLTAIPRIMQGYMGSKYSGEQVDFKTIEMGRFLPFTEYPVYKFTTEFPHFNVDDELYSIDDTKQEDNIITEQKSARYNLKLKSKLDEYDVTKYYLNTFNFNE